MGSIIFTDAHTEITSMLGERTGISARIDRWMNWAHVRLAYNKGLEHYDLQKTDATLVSVAGTRTIALPSDCYAVLSVRDTDNKKKLDWSSWRKFDYHDTSVQNIPSQYARFANNLELDPTPNAVIAYTLRYMLTVPTLSGGLVTSLHMQFDEAWVEMSAAIGFEKLLEPDRAAYHFALADNILEPLKTPAIEEMADASESGMTIGVRKES
jgi:hypothetical protein